ncbi:Putative antitoxin [uncultured archaeon]|nr:Putative antitoxin [uncultured archaeon]
MSVKTITITEDAYTSLATLKEPGESFSDVVRRLSGKSSLLELAGILSRTEASELRKAVRKSRREIDKRVERVARRLA